MVKTVSETEIEELYTWFQIYYAPETKKTIQALVAERDVLYVLMSELAISATELRVAQTAYMADRGNDALGKKVGETAAMLDSILDGLKHNKPHNRV